MTILRWVLVVPGSLLAMMAGSLAGGMAFGIAGNQSLTDAGSAFFGTFLLVFSAGMIAPSSRVKTATVFLCINLVLALSAFVLSVVTSLEGFGDRSALDKVLIPVAQILGSLYALFLLAPVVVPGATLQDWHREIIALGTTVILAGVLISLAGLVVGLFGLTWAGLSTGAGVFVLGIATWLFPFFHLHSRARRVMQEYVRQQSISNNNDVRREG